MSKDPTNWEEKKAIAAVIFGRAVASFAQVAEFMMKLLAQMPPDERLVYRGDPQNWLALYRDPRLVRDRLVDVVFPVEPVDPPTSAMLPMLIWQIGRMHRQSIGNLIAQAGGMAEFQEQFRAGREMWEAIRQAQAAWLSAEFAGDVDPFEDEQIENIMKHPEALFMFRVYMPCILTAHRTPWQLFRAARYGDIDAAEALLRIDKVPLFEPRIAKLFAKSTLEGTDTAQRLAAALAAQFPTPSGKTLKLDLISLVALVYRTFGRVTNRELRMLFDEMAKGESGGTQLIDTDLSDSPEALRQAIHRGQDQWRELLRLKRDKKKS